MFLGNCGWFWGFQVDGNYQQLGSIFMVQVMTEGLFIVRLMGCFSSEPLLKFGEAPFFFGIFVTVTTCNSKIQTSTFQGVPMKPGDGKLAPFRNHLAPFGRSRENYVIILSYSDYTS